MRFTEIKPGQSWDGPVIILPNSAVVARNAAEAEQEGRPQFYYLHEGGRTVLVVNGQDGRQRIPEDELSAMARETLAKVRAKQQPRSDLTSRILTEWWADHLQWLRDHRNGRVAFGPATFAGDRRR